MNKTIKKYAIQTKICPPEALNDPEGYDGYQYYDKLSIFIEMTKTYYVEREKKRAAEEAKDALRSLV
jgi:hypothetical protein